MTATDSSALVAAAAAGDEAAWRALVDRYAGLVWSVTRAFRLSGADAADAFQNAWLRFAEHISRIERPDRVGAWLATTTRRECLQSIKASARSLVTDDMTVFELGFGDDSDLAADPTAGVVLAAEQQRLDAARSAALWEAFSQLPARCRDLLRVLMATPPPSYAEVAAALDLPVGSIGPTRARCLRRLRTDLAGRISGGLSSS